MSDIGLNLGPEQDEEEYDDPEPEHRQPHRRRGPGCMLALVIVLVFALAAVYGGRYVVSEIKNALSPAPDFAGAGTSRVIFQVTKGQTSADIGAALQKKGVVKSVQAFTDAARRNPKSVDIQVGYYRLKKQMKATLALGVLVNPKNLIQSLVLVPEGARIREIVPAIVKNTHLKRSAVLAALKRPAALGLPSAAHGNPEGYLAPATYVVTPGETATTLLRQMVTTTKNELTRLHVAQGAAARGLSVEQVLTLASILEYEARRGPDYPKVAEAIYNRLRRGMPIQSDATVSYASGVHGQIWTSASQRSNPSAYNTYQHTGLPPGPIGSPGKVTIESALHPTKGPWLYWVVVNLRTGVTKFATTLAQHNVQVQQFKDYCKTSSAC